ncbi:hypothetical protein [Desulfovibrio sp. TomC]|uniref:hypothetical protein n=1 Tax=Desulfovibrio sp. TomC TaxID=1562888 RepID=UPI0012E0F5C2|nr:hypothetical protein [Desulfovibrio sp. TomC]
MVPFTYYGDLVGVTSLYSVDPKLGYEALDGFYNTVFNSLSSYMDEHQDVKVCMFSDSMVMYGDDASSALKELQLVYLKLIHTKKLLLRGAMVSGKIDFDPRFTIETFQKHLPKGTELVRAVALESKHKGSRLLVENELAGNLLNEVKSWRTVSGYVDNILGQPVIGIDDIRRRIIQAPEGFAYEYLYFWQTDRIVDRNVHDERFVKERLVEIGKYPRKDVALHYSETISLHNRSRDREKYTKKELGVSE